jgi:hypothetical protein
MRIFKAATKLLPLVSKTALVNLLNRIRNGSPSLCRLCEIYGSDKHGFHYYALHYEKRFKPLRNKPLRIHEIGIGGYDDPSRGGASLRVLQQYFPKARILGLDIHNKSLHNAKTIATIVGDQ